MKNIKKIILSITIFIIFTLQISSAQLNINNHKPAVCFNGCHDTGGFNYGATEDDECGDCHNYKLNILKLEGEHNPKICKVCHNVKDVDSYHILHENVAGSCVTCHKDNGQKPEKSINECAGCHSGRIHTIHQDNISQICEKCHGIRPASNPASGSVSSNNKITAVIYAKVVNYKQFTLYEVFKRIMSSSKI